ncbi:MAG: hypothetical protein M0T77_05795 [Actinomycetota bacterium]|nr:hypothetical protein [Actinomycetota bacterium]
MAEPDLPTLTRLVYVWTRAGFGAAVPVHPLAGGGDTALAAGYDPPQRDLRVDAVIVLSGAEALFLPPFLPASFWIPMGGPPLLASRRLTYDHPRSPEHSQTADRGQLSILFLRHCLEHVAGSLR